MFYILVYCYVKKFHAPQYIENNHDSNFLDFTSFLEIQFSSPVWNDLQ